MKRVLVLGCLLVYNQAFTQTIQPPIKSGFNSPSYRFNCDWYNWMYNERNVDFNTRLITLFPDSFVRNLSYDSVTNTRMAEWNYFNSVAVYFDGDDDEWGDCKLLPYNNRYFVDSIFLPYAYFRHNPNDSIVDTMVFQIGIDTTQTFRVYDDSLLGKMALPKLDVKTGRCAAFFKEIKIPLTYFDTTKLNNRNHFHLKYLAASIDDGGYWFYNHYQLFYTVSYIPGQKYNVGDTLGIPIGDSVTVQNPLNQFMIVGMETGNLIKNNSYNNASFVTKHNRYSGLSEIDGMPANHYRPPYFTNHQDSTFLLFPRIILDINDLGLSVNENAMESIRLYPNPVHSTLNFQANESLNLSIYNAKGLCIYSNRISKEAQVQINISTWSRGFYMAKFASESGMFLQKVIVH